MENTGSVLFEDDSSQWYIAVGEKWLGPLTASEVYQKIQTGEVTWAHFLWKQGQSEWKRACDTKTFQPLVPNQPKKTVQLEVKNAAKPMVKTSGRRSTGESGGKAGGGRSWFLHFNDSQYGPFSEDEVRKFLHSGKIHRRVYAWKDGLDDWSRIEDIDVFEKDSAAAPGSGGRSEQRVAPRRPVVAKIVMAQGESVIVGVCRDISVGGMQVLTDKVPGEVGARIKMNVSPAGKGPMEPFVAEGVIVRVLEDGRGFSFRFNKLSEGSRRAIEAYIEETF